MCDEENAILIPRKFKTTKLNSITNFSINYSYMLGPAIVCLPFIMQKSGLIPTLITLIFICTFSLFSSYCLIETGKLTNSKNLEYNYLIERLFSDSIFSLSSRSCVYINYLLSIMLSIITLSKVFNIFFIQKYTIFFPILYAVNNTKDYDNNMFDYNYIISNENIIILLIIFGIFVLLFFLNRITQIFKKIMSNIIVLLSIVLGVYMLFKLNNQKLNFFKRVPLFGTDYTYLYGTVLFSFSYTSLLPRWVRPEDHNHNVIKSSSIFAFIFKVIFSISFGYLIDFHGDFSIKDYRDHNLIIGLFFIFTLMNNIINHTESLYQSFKPSILYMMISIIIPWILSLLLLIDAKIFLCLINWSSILIFGFINLILPLLLYNFSLNDSELYESNYKQSALIDFENFIYLKKQEIEIDSDNIMNAFRKNNDECGILKEYIIDIIYVQEGFHSINKSFHNLFGDLINHKKKVVNILYSFILFLLLLMISSIYISLYNFLINKTLVVNIFLQIN